MNEMLVLDRLGFCGLMLLHLKEFATDARVLCLYARQPLLSDDRLVWAIREVEHVLGNLAHHTEPHHVAARDAAERALEALLSLADVRCGNGNPGSHPEGSRGESATG